MTAGNLVLGLGFGSVWLICAVVSALKGRFLSAIYGLFCALAIVAGWSVGDLDKSGDAPRTEREVFIMFNPFVWIPVWTAIRLARPDSWWSNRFYSNNTFKFIRALIRWRLVREYIENRRKALTPEEFEQCLALLRVTALRGRAATEYVNTEINAAS
ncbi:MAG: hypothetical protein C5B50_03075 [Verrucomicrobia bacterium]|nr:MAG: hypothetical protein C5B50_03075 [Verrucomicrobiota bacterium]